METKEKNNRVLSEIIKFNILLLTIIFIKENIIIKIIVLSIYILYRVHAFKKITNKINNTTKRQNEQKKNINSSVINKEDIPNMRKRSIDSYYKGYFKNQKDKVEKESGISKLIIQLKRR